MNRLDRIEDELEQLFLLFFGDEMKGHRCQADPCREKVRGTDPFCPVCMKLVPESIAEELRIVQGVRHEHLTSESHFDRDDSQRLRHFRLLTQAISAVRIARLA